ncbi:hypothetical protein POM88_015550 [Heracleum sosnowskyi]|uniref:Protein kinase domain-containing protein n=1 Tax=Heracleum sosnowskyi TaxID=360622 RepID=A0AAD8IN40_9APIA|nr:hypothetical protein POM88_015550 [Heracleum sosnowskyi]
MGRELASTLHLLRSQSKDLTCKDQESASGDLQKLYDTWEFHENDVMNAQAKLRSIRAKLATLEGKIALSIIESQKIVEEKQRRVDCARRALQLLQTTTIIWPNSASEVLLTGSCDGWTTQGVVARPPNISRKIRDMLRAKAVHGNSLLTAKGVNLEVQALMSIKAALKDSHGVLAKWDSDAADPCSWTMVTCSTDYLVIGLGTPSQSLSGILSPSIGNLTNLLSVLLQNNNISVPLPTELGGLSKLQTLDLSDNLFTGDIPSSLANLESLQSLLWTSGNSLLTAKGVNLEVQALMSIKAALKDSHGVLAKWDSDAADPCSWTMMNSKPKLSGILSPSIGNLTNLLSVLLQNNNISVPLPTELGGLSKLQTLDLSDNLFTGDIPSSLANLESLQSLLWTSGNSLLTAKGVNLEVQALMSIKAALKDSHGVLAKWDSDAADPCSWTMVTCSTDYLVIGLGTPSQSLSGILSPSIGNLTNLLSVLLQNNNISVPLPTELGGFSKLQTLDLSDNLFTGDIPSSLANLESLQSLRLNNNSLSGAIPLSMANMTQLTFLDLSSNNLSGPVPRLLSKTFSILGNPMICATGKEQDCNRSKPMPLSLNSNNQKQRCEEVCLGNMRRFQFRELQDGTIVAVKRLKDGNAIGGEIQFQTEVEMISLAVHRNLLRLYGFCMTTTERRLVYPYMSNGSVALRLKSKPALDWGTRKCISLGAGRGLLYLHEQCDPKIIHRDVKAANILLDDYCEAVVGDFGLAKLLDHRDSQVTTAVRGTVGHIAPEYLSTGQSSEKTDVFGKPKGSYARLG